MRDREAQCQVSDPALPLVCCAPLDKAFHPSEPSFLICTLEMINPFPMELCWGQMADTRGSPRQHTAQSACLVMKNHFGTVGCGMRALRKDDRALGNCDFTVGCAGLLSVTLKGEVVNLFDLRQASLPDMGKSRLEELMACLLGIPRTASPVLSPAMRR